MNQIKFGRLRGLKAGIGRLLTSAEAHKVVNDYAQRVADAAGPTYEAHESPSRNRARATVYSEDFAARRRDNQSQTLLGAIGQAKE